MLVKILYSFIFFFLISATIFAQEIQIKNLKVYSVDEVNLPIDNITISFDVKADYVPELDMIFRFCDKDWAPYDNIFLLNQGNNIAYTLDFARLPVTVADADYHFIGDFPNNYDAVTFPWSGNWRFYVVDSYDTSKVYASGKFYVIDSEVSLSASVKRDMLEDKVYFPIDLSRVFNVTANFYLPEKLDPPYVKSMYVIENHKINYPYVVNRTGNTNQRQFYWNGSNRFEFTIRDIHPGKEYRQTDIRDINVFNSKNVNAQFDGLEYSRFYKNVNYNDLNGGSKILDFENDYSEYLNVTFSIRPPDNVWGNIFLVGSFNNWKLSTDYMMNSSGGVYSLTVPLKRGIYDYQYVTADLINDEIKNANWLILEGNTWETENVYHIFIYYKEPNYGGYDKIIGYKKLKSR